MKAARDNFPFWLLVAIVVVVVLLMLNGCAQTPPRPLVDSVQAIPIPSIVVEPCLDPKQIPPLPRNVMPGDTADIRALANGNAANVERLLETLETQRRMLEGCAKLQQQPKG